MRPRRSTAAAALAAALVVFGTASGQPAEPARGMGLEPVSEEEYAAFPKVRAHRDYFGPRVDLSDRFPPPRSQGRYGTCVAWAVGYAARAFLASAEAGRPLTAPETPSPAYIYNAIKRQPGCDAGTAIPHALDLLKSEGAPPWSQAPYEQDWCDQPPSPEAKAAAPRFRISGWRAVARRDPVTGLPTNDRAGEMVIDDIKGQLWKGRPVVFAMRTPEAFQNFPGGVPEVWNYQPKEGETFGGHAMALVGYDNDRQAFRLINSWGTDWGQGGYLWIGYDTFKRLTREAYIMEPLKEAAPPPPRPLPPTTLPVQARLKQALAAPDCGRLDVTMRDGKAVVTGFGGSAEQLAALKRTAEAVDPAVTWRARYLPWPQCETELIVEPVADESAARVTLAKDGTPLTGEVARLADEDWFTLEAEAAAARPFLHLVYVQADGSAVELYRGAPKPDETGRRRIRVGASGPQGVRLKVSPPFGDEVLLAVASDRPVLSERLADYATERQFLSAFKTALVEARAEGRAVSATVTHIHTAPAAPEVLVTRLVTGFQEGRPRLDKFTPPFAEKLQPHLERMRTLLAPLGPVRSVRADGVEPDGARKYEVQHARGRSSWKFWFEPDGQIRGTWYWVGTPPPPA